MLADADRIYTLLKEVFLLMEDGDRRLFSIYQLSQARFYALYHLGEHPGISSRELSDLMLCDKSNITRLIKGMESEQLVHREPHESDGRTLRLFLTSKGRQLRQQAITAHQRYNSDRFDRCLSAAEDGSLLKYLRLLRDGLHQQLVEIGGSHSPS